MNDLDKTRRSTPGMSSKIRIGLKYVGARLLKVMRVVHDECWGPMDDCVSKPGRQA